MPWMIDWLTNSLHRQLKQNGNRKIIPLQKFWSRWFWDLQVALLPAVGSKLYNDPPGVELQLSRVCWFTAESKRWSHIKNTKQHQCGLSDLNLQKPIILCGDLNTSPTSLIYSRLSRFRTDVQKASGASRKPRPTFPSNTPVFRIDHIFVSDHFETMSAEAIKNALPVQASDHLPLVAEIKCSALPITALNCHVFR